MKREEPWLRGVDLGVHPALAEPLFALQQTWEDVSEASEGLSTEQIWSSPYGITPIGYHLRHLAGSTDRLTTYVRGGQLTAAQLEASRRGERTPGADREELLHGIGTAFAVASDAIRSLPPEFFAETRYIGCKRIPTTAIGLAIHIGEHAQRHAGQIVIIARLLR